ncbi:hypothetical protein [Crassaminicella profunda]|jgi:hypothetical protein|uniref:hypothetical protein n=1 Tax=Crassaminicella profunda TaxID=1286698 RepID=UPI001CA626CC|nr:hypothetical protein [Crassaminicella profunda]QZY56032.1 hypothetical protein K7H06_03250 [Crassaminicella profunda]
MWTVVYMAHNKADADRIQCHLMNEGFLVKLKPIGREEEGVFEVLVPNGEAEEAHEVLVNL